MTTESLTREALLLSDDQKIRLIDSLWDSLDDAQRKAIDQAWLDESLERLAAHDSGKVSCVDASTALDGIEKEIQG
ncbi:addiction module protein [Kamptonema cortianum]|nr:addiction module protein [Oscillatoria laete-virens]MDK3157996.1 addiction module protein [Kamptonema cortianum]MDL5053126.1 addiction module protein [Oscillatoria laete-virens NRMC-F 0139]